MDQRAARQALEVMERCHGDPYLSINSGGQGPLSAEWMIPKCLWMCEKEPEIWTKAAIVCEYQDYINFRLTGSVVASSCNAATRWHWNGDECIQQQESMSGNNPHPGRPVSLYEKLGIPELADKLPQRCLPPGSKIGMTTPEATDHLGLEDPVPVVQGGADAFVGMVGLGCIRPGQMCLITGSSHLHCVVTDKAGAAPGTWGAYTGAPLPGLKFAEGGQSSTGSLLRWARDKILTAGCGGGDAGVGVDVDRGTPPAPSYSDLDAEAGEVPPGSDGLVALETFQGSRTPVTDPMARGAFVGLTLSHTRAHLWRSLLEAVCYGTRACVGALEEAGHPCREIVMAGGATRSPLWLQLHADVTGKTVVVCENSDAPLLGSAVLAAVGVGLHGSVPDAVAAMVRVARRIEPDPKASAAYDDLFERVYKPLADAVRPVSHAVSAAPPRSAVRQTVALTGGMTLRANSPHSKRRRFAIEELVLVGRGENDSEEPGTEVEETDAESSNASLAERYYPPVVSPSLLACDWSRIRHEVGRCLKAGASRLHVDVFDGVFLDSPKALTFGPQMVAAIRRSCNRVAAVSHHAGLEDNNEGDDATGTVPPHAILDLHMCVDKPRRYVVPMAEAGGDRFVFQWEALESAEAAIELAVDVRAAGMACGVSINPGTSADEIIPLLATNLVDVVDVLAVEPGFGGQVFQRRVLEKVRRLKEWREENRVDFDIMVDGGINRESAREALEAGANVLVSGSYLFNHKRGMASGIETILKQWTMPQG
jgi:ribulose-phosphate 3-epimerase